MQRIRSLDLARGFTVLFIPAIHAGMLYSNLPVHHTSLGHVLIFIAEGPGGQLLMLLMGLSFTFKPSHSSQPVFIKSLGLILTGYLLNILKFVVPYSLGLLPFPILQELHIESENAIWQLAGIGDILHFSGIALLVLHGLYKIKHYHRVATVLALLVTILSPSLWDMHSAVDWINYLLQLATGQPPQVFFPLLPWLVYPLIGLAIGYYFKKNQEKTMLACGVTSVILLMIGLLGEYYFPLNYPAGFYRTSPFATSWHLGIVLLTLHAWFLVNKHTRDNFFFRLLQYSSKNITAIYILQWIMICWALPMFGFRQLDLWTSAIVMIAMTINTYLVCYTIQLLKQQYEQPKNI